MADQQFCLRWNNHQSTLISVFDTLLENGTLVDCTLAAEGQYLKAHKVVLSACSPYLETLLSQHYEKHPIVILKDVKFTELKSMMDYMYRGEVNISQDQLGTFLKAAESLQIKGLSDNGADGDARDVGSTAKVTTRKANVPAPSNRPEPARPDSPLTDGSMSPSSRKRRRIRRSSRDDDSHLENNSCDLPSQAQSTPVPNIPAANSSITTTIVKPAIVKPEQTDINRIDSNTLPPEALKKEIEPISEPLLEPKTEYLEDVNNEDSVEDLTLDDDDDMDGMDISNMSNMSNMSRPGPSHGNDISSQGFAAWNLGANQSGTDEVFMAAQEAVNQHRDSQGIGGELQERRKSNRSRRQSETYISVECRYRSVKSSKRGRKPSVVEIKQEPESEEDRSIISNESERKTTVDIKQEPGTEEDLMNSQPNFIPPSPERSLQRSPAAGKSSEGKKKSPLGKQSKSEKRKLSPKRSVTFQVIKTEPSFEPSTSAQSAAEIPSVSDDLEYTQPAGELPSISDDLEYIQKNISTETEMETETAPVKPIPKKRGKKPSFNPKLGHKCEFCGRIYKYRKGMLQHQRLECNQEPQFPCPYCPAKFRYRHKIRDHVHDEHNQAYARWYNLFYQTSIQRKVEKKKQQDD